MHAPGRFGQKDLQKLQEQLERCTQELKRTAVALTASRGEASELLARVNALQEEAEVAREAQAARDAKSTQFALHVKGSRKLKEENAKLQKLVASLEKKLQQPATNKR